MRKLKLQVQVSMDGFIAGPNGEMDWMLWDWSQDLKDYVTELCHSVDTILLGRNLATGFIPYWSQSYASAEPAEGAEFFAKAPKVVFSKTLETCEWDNTLLAKGDLVEEINSLKNKAGKDLIVYGGASFVSSLIQANLIDELHLFINPSILGKGMPIFQSVKSPQNYTLIGSKHSACGIMVLTYQKT